MSDPAAEFDGPWKEALDLYFRPFVELFFPDIHGEVDWDREIDWQDKELPKLFPDAAAGTGVVDKLAGVWTRAGEQERVFVHVEVQTQSDPDLARRMYRYNHRLEDRYGAMPVSLAVLGDAGRSWRPNEYRAGRWGCEVAFTFRTAKLADWRGREAALEQSPNPFAVFVLAHLKTVETDRTPEDRLAWKSRIVKGLYDRGLDRAEMLKVFRLIDWMMTLPPVLTNLFARDLTAFEEERKMPFITGTEQMWLDQGIARGLVQGRTEGETRGRTEGRTEGLLAGIETVLDLRFGAAGSALMPRLRQITDPAALEWLLRESKSAPDIPAFAALLPAPPTA
ncbi:hypothetical protein [Gemmata sp.]|uniref:hypothetical protein n=1 Tax=Gemmata sp. TaxID=1914242 RepID=UPI003F7033B5